MPMLNHGEAGLGNGQRENVQTRPIRMEGDKALGYGRHQVGLRNERGHGQKIRNL